MKSITTSISEKMTLEDKIVFFRFKAGLIYGIFVFISSLFITPQTLNPYAWATSILAYHATIIYVAVKYRPLTRFQLYLRGLATFYATWILTVIILFELVKLLGG